MLEAIVDLAFLQVTLVALSVLFCTISSGLIDPEVVR